MGSVAILLNDKTNFVFIVGQNDFPLIENVLTVYRYIESSFLSVKTSC